MTHEWDPERSLTDDFLAQEQARWDEAERAREERDLDYGKRSYAPDWGLKRPELSLQMSAERKGKNNPNYRHGGRVGQHDRRLARAFSLDAKGEFRCRLCGSRENVQPHHAIPRSLGTAESRIDIRNLLPLCAACHSGWHQRGVLITRDIFTDEEWAYISTVQLTGRETTPWLDDRYPTNGSVLTCRNGHPRTPENTYVHEKTGHKQCRACKRVGRRPDLETHCPKGHSYEEFGMYWRNGPNPDRKYRLCKECARIANAARKRADQVAA